MSFLKPYLIGSLYLLTSAGVAYASGFGPEPTERGPKFNRHVVCPDGAVAEKSPFHYAGDADWSTRLGKGFPVYPVKVINAKIFTGKAVANYTDNELDAIADKFLHSEISTPGAYSSETVEREYLRVIMSLNNSEGKVITFRGAGGGGGGEIIDSRGRMFNM